MNKTIKYLVEALIADANAGVNETGGFDLEGFKQFFAEEEKEHAEEVREAWHYYNHVRDGEMTVEDIIRLQAR